MPVRVRAATPTDLPAFLGLVDALAEYERLPGPDAEGRRRLAADARAGRFHLLLGEREGAVVGYAAWVLTYSTFLARPTFYLEDLFVLPAARGAGVGGALFRTCAAEAVRRGCGRMEWAVLDWNQTARAFYDRMGARRLEEWLPYRLEGEALRRMAEGLSASHA